MSRKHYVAVAAVVARDADIARRMDSYAALASVRSIAHGLADVFASDNPRFDRGRFLAACGVSEDN